MTFTEVLFCLGWAVASVLSYGATCAFFWRACPSLQVGLDRRETIREARRVAFVFALLGPVGLMASFLCGDQFKHGFIWRLR